MRFAAGLALGLALAAAALLARRPEPSGDPDVSGGLYRPTPAPYPPPPVYDPYALDPYALRDPRRWQ